MDFLDSPQQMDVNQSHSHKRDLLTAYLRLVHFSKFFSPPGVVDELFSLTESHGVRFNLLSFELGIIWRCLFSRIDVDCHTVLEGFCQHLYTLIRLSDSDESRVSGLEGRDRTTEH